MIERDPIQPLTTELISGRLSRRDFITRAAALGLSASAIASVLIACGTDAPATSAPVGSTAPAASTAPLASTAPVASAAPSTAPSAAPAASAAPASAAPSTAASAAPAGKLAEVAR